VGSAAIKSVLSFGRYPTSDHSSDPKALQQTAFTLVAKSLDNDVEICEHSSLETSHVMQLREQLHPLKDQEFLV